MHGNEFDLMLRVSGTCLGHRLAVPCSCTLLHDFRFRHHVQAFDQQDRVAETTWHQIELLSHAV